MDLHNPAFDHDFHRPSSPPNDSVSASTLHHLRAHHKTRALDDPSYNSSGPINAIDRLLQNLSPLPSVTNVKVVIARDSKWEFVEKRTQEKTLAVAGPVNAIDRIIQGIPPLADDEKQLMVRRGSWEVDTTVCGSVSWDGTTQDGSDEGTEVEEVTPRQTQPCRKRKEKGVEPWIEEDEGYHPDNASDDGFDSGSAIWSRPSHQSINRTQEHTDDASDAGSDATSVCHITEGPLTKLQFDHVNGAERSRQGRWREEEQAREERWKSELSQTQLRKVQRQRRQAGRKERRQARKQRREKAIGKAKREERWQATKAKITHLLKEVTWHPALMPQLTSRLCPDFGRNGINSSQKVVDEEESEADTDTDDEEIQPDWSKYYCLRDPPEPPDSIELYNRARELNVVLQEEKHRWAKLKRHNEGEMRRGRKVILDYEAPIELVMSQCKHCVEEHVDDLFPIIGPWWRECGICDSRGQHCERDNRDDDDDERKPPRNSFIPSGLIRAAKLGRGDENDDSLDGEGSNSDSEDGNHGNDGIASQNTTPPPPMILPIAPPAINYSKYGACDEVQREFFEERHRDLQWKTGYLDNKLELGVLGDYIDYVDDRIEAIDREPIHAGHHLRWETYQVMSERAGQLARQQKEKDFWEGLRENLELDELEVAGKLQENHYRHSKDDEECSHLADDVNALFKKHMKSAPDSSEFRWGPGRYESQQQPQPEPQETNVTQARQGDQTAIALPEIVCAMPGSCETDHEVEDQHEEVMQDEQGPSQEPHETLNTQEVHETQLKQGATQEGPHESQSTQDEIHESLPIRETPAVGGLEVRRRAHEMYDVRDDQDMLEILDAQDTQAIADRQQRIYDRLLGERPERPDTEEVDWQLWDEAGEICVRQQQEFERQAHEDLSWAVAQESMGEENIPETELENVTQESECEEEDDFESAHGEDNDSGSLGFNNDDVGDGHASAHSEEMRELSSITS